MTLAANPESVAALYVGVGVDTYVYRDTFPPIQNAVAEVKDVSDILSRYGYTAHVFPDPERTVSEELNDLMQPDIVRCGGALVMLWSGHGERTQNGGLNLVARNTKPGSAALLTPAYLADLAARTGASQILVIIDTCFSGAGVMSATTVAAAVLKELPPDAQRVWIGVVASSLDFERARDGAFGTLLRKLLRKGPDDDELKRRWSSHSAGVRGDDLIDALQKEGDNAGLTIDAIESGNAWVMLPNPIYKQPAADRMDAHLVRAARGGEPDDERSYFSGRVSVLNRIVAWMKDGNPGVLAVIGPPGIGKSAIVGRIVSLSDPEERRRLLAQASVEHADPGERSVHAHVHALRYTAERVIVAIDEQLVSGGFLPPDPNGSRNRGELLGAIQRSGRRPVIAIDGLNEAGPESWRIAENVVRTLGEVSIVLVGTQNLPPADSPLSLIQSVGALEVIDLGDPAIQAETEADLRRYVEQRLPGVEPAAKNASRVATMVLEFSREQRAGAFLLAHLITAELARSRVDTSKRNWKNALVRSIEQRIDTYVAGLPPLDRGGVELPHAARELLAALAWAKGPGMPDDIWPIVASAVSPTGTTYERSDVFWLLARTDHYVMEDGQGGRAVYRLVHQSLLDHFRAGDTDGSPEPLTSDESAIRIARALVTYYHGLLTAGQSPQRPAYLWRYIWQHCAEAGQPGIEVLRSLRERNSKAFARDLALALTMVSRRQTKLHRLPEAVTSATEAVEIYRELAATDPAMRLNLAEALLECGNRQFLNGHWYEALIAASEAIDLFRTMSIDNPAVRVPLAAALSGLGLYRLLKGEWRGALEAGEEAVHLVRDGGTSNSAMALELAVALTVVGLGHLQIGKPEEGRDAAKRAVEIFKSIDTANPATRPQFAWALATLAIGYLLSGQSLEARDTAREAVDLLETRDADNAIMRQAKASALTVLGQSCALTGEPELSLAAARQAVELFATMDIADPNLSVTFATALATLGSAYYQTGQPQEALDPATRAVDLFRTMDVTNPVIVQTLSSALTIVGLVYAQTGQAFKACDSAQEAVDLLRTLDTSNPAIRLGLAWALAALGLSNVLIGEMGQTLKTASEAAALFTEMDASNPSVARMYGLTLANHALASLQTGLLEQARQSGEHAVALLKVADPTNIQVVPLAWALIVLAQCYLALDRAKDAQDTAAQVVDLLRAKDLGIPLLRIVLGLALSVRGESYIVMEQTIEARDTLREAVELFETIGTANPMVPPNLARALMQLAACYSKSDQPEQAVETTRKAIHVCHKLAASGPLGLTLLAAALVQLGDQLRAARRGTEADADWAAAIAVCQTPRQKSFLLLRRAEAREAGDPAAIADLVQAQSLVKEAERDLVVDLHRLCRGIRSREPEGFDAEWRREAGDVPTWLTVSPSVLESLFEWMTQSSAETAMEYLRKHLDSWPAEDDAVALDEIALALESPSDVERFRQLLASARAVGVDEAYRPRVAMNLLTEWMSSDAVTTREMLHTRRDELLAPVVEEVLQALIAANADDVELVAHKALLDLARLGREDLGFQTIDDPAHAASSLIEPALAGEIELLAVLTTLATIVAESDAVKADFHFHQAIALAVQKQPENARRAVAVARGLDVARVPVWLALLVQQVNRHPELIPLSQDLVAPQA